MLLCVYGTRISFQAAEAGFESALQADDDGHVAWRRVEGVVRGVRRGDGQGGEGGGRAPEGGECGGACAGATPRLAPVPPARAQRPPAARAHPVRTRALTCITADALPDPNCSILSFNTKFR